MAIRGSDFLFPLHNPHLEPGNINFGKNWSHSGSWQQVLALDPLPEVTAELPAVLTGALFAVRPTQGTDPWPGNCCVVSLLVGAMRKSFLVKQEICRGYLPMLFIFDTPYTSRRAKYFHPRKYAGTWEEFWSTQVLAVWSFPSSRTNKLFAALDYSWQKLWLLIEFEHLCWNCSRK